jgi:hypothetical protein
MAGNERIGDAEFFARALAALPRNTGVPMALSARILADFDTVQARRRIGFRLKDLTWAAWPGTPLWKPGAAFAVSLLCGLAAGLSLPATPAAADAAAAQSQWAYTSPALDMLGDM